MEYIFTIGVIGIWSLLFNLTSFKKESKIFLGRKIYKRRQINQGHFLHYLLVNFRCKIELFRSWWDSNTGPWRNTDSSCLNTFWTVLHIFKCVYNFIRYDLQVNTTVWTDFHQVSRFLFIIVWTFSLLNRVLYCLDPFCDFLWHFVFYEII